MSEKNKRLLHLIALNREEALDVNAELKLSYIENEVSIRFGIKEFEEEYASLEKEQKELKQGDYKYNAKLKKSVRRKKNCWSSFLI